MQASVYRFYRNERNVCRAECIINKTSISTDMATTHGFSELYNECIEEYNTREGKSAYVNDWRTNESPQPAKNLTQSEFANKGLKLQQSNGEK